jgi:hypothetical protein
MKSKLLLLGAMMTSFYSYSQLNYTISTGQPFEGLFRSESILIDIDQDNDLDIIAMGNSTYSGTTYNTLGYINDGEGNFTTVDLNITGMIRGAMASGDLDGDGDNDLIISGEAETGVLTEYYVNDGNGNFTLTTSSLTDVSYGNIKLVDIDNDNDLDVCLTGQNGGALRLKFYRNDGTGNFIGSNPNDTYDGFYDGDLDFQDLNNDGYLDFVAQGRFNAAIGNRTYMNNGDGFFTEGLLYYASAAGNVFIRDFDNDNDFDVFMNGFYSSGGILTSRSSYFDYNDVTEEYTLLDQGIIHSSQSECIAEDLDRDGDVDLFIAGHNYQSSSEHALIYENDGSGDFTVVQSNSFYDLVNGSSTLGDVDGDGDLDIFVTGADYNGELHSVLYLNNTYTLANKENDHKNVSIYPNPTNGIFKIKIEESNNSKITITNSAGKVIKNELLYEEGFSIDLTNESTGIYFITISNDNGVFTRKINKI